MARNLGRLDQFLRIIVGLALVAYAVRDGVLAFGSVAAAVIGAVLLLTAFFSFCPLYTLLGISTRKRLDRLA